MKKDSKDILESLIKELIKEDSETGAWSQAFSNLFGGKDLDGLSKSKKVKYIKLPDVVRRDISDFNKVLDTWADETLRSIYAKKEKEQDYFEDAISDAASLFVDMGGSEEHEISSSSFLNLFLEKIKDALKLDLNVYNYRSNLPQFEFELSIPVLGGEEGFEEEKYKEAFGEIIKGKNSLDAAFEKTLANMEKKIKSVFDKNVNTIIQAWDNERVFEYIKSEFTGKSTGTKSIDFTFLSDLLTGGAITIPNIDKELKEMGMSDYFSSGMKNVAIWDAVDFWLIVGSSFGAAEGILTFGEITSASGSNKFKLLRYVAKTGARFLRGVIYYVAYICIPALIIAATLNGINIVRKPFYAKKLIETFQSSVLKMIEIYFNDLRAIKDKIIEEILEYSTDYDYIYALVKNQSNKSYSKIQQEIKNSMKYESSVRDNVDTGAMTLEQFFFSGAYLPVEIFKYLFMTPSHHVSYDVHIKNMGGREELINQYQKYYKDADFETMSDKNLYDFIKNHEYMRAMDYFEWYGKTNKVKKGNVFSPREGQFLNDIFKMSSNKVKIKNTDDDKEVFDSEVGIDSRVDVAQEEEGGATFFNNFVESSPTAIINAINAALFSIIISIDSESNIIPSVLEEIDNIFKTCIEELESNSEDIFSAFPFQKLENVFSKIEKSNEKTFVTPNNEMFSSQKFPLKIYKKRVQ